MKMGFCLCALASVQLFAGCDTTSGLHLSQSAGEFEAQSTYVPMDPLPVARYQLDGCPTVMSAFPDQSVRVALRNLTNTANASAGIGNITRSGSNYEVILDYVSTDTIGIPFKIDRPSSEKPSTVVAVRVASALDSSGTLIPGVVVIPIYVGVGVRLTADIVVKKVTGALNLTSLAAIGAAAERGEISGSMTVQVMGLNSDRVTTLLPLPSTINSTTIENAILALGSIKATLPELRNDSYASTPRLIGMYNPISNYDATFINQVESQLAALPTEWIKACNDPPKSPLSASQLGAARRNN